MSRIKFVMILYVLSVLAVMLSAMADEPDSNLSSAPGRAVGFPIGIEGIPEHGDGASWKAASELKLNLAMQWASWDESVPYSYSWTASPSKDEFKQHLVRLKKQGYTIAIADTSVHMDQKHLPKDLEGKRFNDPEVLARWAQHLEDFLARYGDEVDFLNLGNEVDLYFGSHQDEWEDYITFFERGAATVRRLRPAITIGVVLKPEKWSLTKCWRALEPFCDFLAVTYYPPNSMFETSPTAEAFSPDHPKHFTKEFERAFRFAGEKPVMIIEVGAASDPVIGSSPELQAQFIRLLFEWLPGKEDRLLGMLWLTAQDWPRERIKKDLTGDLSASLLEMDPFMRFLCSLGLKYEDGTPKPGYAAFREEMIRYRALP
jgi:hypothetical protein